MKLTDVKRMILVAWLVVIVSVLVAVLGSGDHTGWRLGLILQFPMVFGVFWLYLARLKCPSCGTPLSRDFPVGSLTMLPFSRQLCKKCHKVL